MLPSKRLTVKNLVVAPLPLTKLVQKLKAVIDEVAAAVVVIVVAVLVVADLSVTHLSAATAGNLRVQRTIKTPVRLRAGVFCVPKF